MNIEKVVIGNATLYFGDCCDVIPILDKVDAIVTDMPYGVLLGEVDNGQAREKNQISYSSFSDTPEYLDDVAIPALTMALEKADCGLVFTGNRNVGKYPTPAEIGCWYVPAAMSRGKWGFVACNIILYYGKSPRAGRGDFANSFSMQTTSEKNGHPCPKPIKVMRWCVNKVTTEKDKIVLDPFMGSGTTGVACMEQQRKFIGIEIEREYFDVACKRIEQAQQQLHLGL